MYSYAVVNFSFVMFWTNVYCLWFFFFCGINPAKGVRRYNSSMQLPYLAVNSWLTIPTLGIPHHAQNARDMGMGMPKTRGCPKRCDTAPLRKKSGRESSLPDFFWGEGPRGCVCTQANAGYLNSVRRSFSFLLFYFVLKTRRRKTKKKGDDGK